MASDQPFSPRTETLPPTVHEPTPPTGTPPRRLRPRTNDVTYDDDAQREFDESSDSDMEGSRSRDKGSKAKASSPLARESSSEDGGLPEEIDVKRKCEAVGKLQVLAETISTGLGSLGDRFYDNKEVVAIWY